MLNSSTCTRTHRHRQAAYARAHRGRHLPVVQTGLSRPDSAQGSRSPWFSRVLRDSRWKRPQRPSTGRCRTHRPSSVNQQTPNPPTPQKYPLKSCRWCGEMTEKAQDGSDVRGAPGATCRQLDPPVQQSGEDRRRPKARTQTKTATGEKRTESGHAASNRPSVRPSRGGTAARFPGVAYLRGGCAPDRDAHNVTRARTHARTHERLFCGSLLTKLRNDRYLNQSRFGATGGATWWRARQRVRRVNHAALSDKMAFQKAPGDILLLRP